MFGRGFTVEKILYIYIPPQMFYSSPLLFHNHSHGYFDKVSQAMHAF